MIMKRTYFLIFSLITFAVVSSCKKEPIYKNPNAPLESRVRDLLERMTLEEKLSQIDIWHPKMDLSKPEELAKAIDALGDTVRNGIGFLQFQVRMSQSD
jgi:beta-glucosidase